MRKRTGNMREDTKNMDNNDERDEEGTVKRKGKINKQTNEQTKRITREDKKNTKPQK